MKYNVATLFLFEVNFVLKSIEKFSMSMQSNVDINFFYLERRFIGTLSLILYDKLTYYISMSLNSQKKISTLF